jgi:hypothetical protein
MIFDDIQTSTRISTPSAVLRPGAGAGLGFASAEPMLPLAQSPKVSVQLTNSDGRCWTADFSAPALVNQGTTFRDRGD